MAPDDKHPALAPLTQQCNLSIAEVTAELAPIPYIGPLANSLAGVFQAIEKSRTNKKQWRLLQGRCVMVLRIAGSQVMNNRQMYYARMKEGVQKLEVTLTKIQNRAWHYNWMHEVTAFLKHVTISDEIEDLFSELDACLRRFGYVSEVAQAQWVTEFRPLQEQEASEFEQVRSELGKMGVKIHETGQKGDQILAKTERIVDALQQLLNDKSSVLQDQSNATADDYVDAQKIVRTILSVTHLRLPPKLLLGRQCILDARVPVKTGITCLGYPKRNLWKKYAERFLRIAALWYDFRSDYTLPFYGIGMEAFEGTNHFQLYMVSPLMKNYDAMTYLKQYRKNAGMKKNILGIITDAALGLQYLHNRHPPVVYSGMKGDNILITDSGGAVLGGFGLTNALEITESQRWMAPEMFVDEPVLETPCDIWGWAMAALEIISGSIPYYKHRQGMAVMLAVMRGPPKREDYPEFNTYAYRPEEMWDLLTRCWELDPAKRPIIDEVVAELRDIAKMQESDMGNVSVMVSPPVPTLNLTAIRQVFTLLLHHGCLDLTRQMSVNQDTAVLMNGGGFGDIWMCQLQDGARVAIKAWRAHMLGQCAHTALKHAAREIHTWSQMKHKNIHQLVGVMMFKEYYIGMVSEWMDNGNLHEYMLKHPQLDRYQMCAQVTSGLSYMHRCNVVHGDLKALNILVSPEGVAKLTDFGLSTVAEASLAFSETTGHRQGFSTRWAAPELLLDELPKSKQSDVYALGMTMLEIFSGSIPYSEYKKDFQVMLKVQEGILPLRPPQISDESRGDLLWHLLVNCWNRDSNKRPRAIEVYDYLNDLSAKN
ncbi:hypothetical protein OPQ81_000052 [Rhizoctonia solani]|nr:hypothetical protein OPQ81_000052 [Rhizoctonia solani]